MRTLNLFHYHLVTSKVRALEGRYLGKLGFELIGRYGWRGENSQWFEPGTSWEALDEMGFRLRLVELSKGAVNVVIQPGHWDVPRVDHFGIALDDSEYETVLDRADELGLKIQDHPGKRTFVTTDAGYRLEVHPPRDWIEEALSPLQPGMLASDVHRLAIAIRSGIGIEALVWLTDIAGAMPNASPVQTASRPVASNAPQSRDSRV